MATRTAFEKPLESPAQAAHCSPWPRRLSALAWLPIALMAAAIAVVYFLRPAGVYESRALLLLLNLVLPTLASAAVAVFTTRAFLRRGEPGLLLLTGGVAVWGAAAPVAILIARDPGVMVTAHNILCWIASLFHLAGAAVAVSTPVRLVRRRTWLAGAGATAAAIVLLVALGVLGGTIPTFFFQGRGGSIWRDVVLLSAVASFAFAAMLLRPRLKATSRFAHWYSLALVSMAMGLFTAMLQTSTGSLLNWMGRSMMLLGGLYLFPAAWACVRSPAATPQAAPALWQQRYWWGVAIVLSLAAAGFRAALLQSLQDQAPLVTFFPAIILAALYGGLRAGLLATVLSGVLLDYLCFKPVGFGIANPADWVVIGLFLLGGLLISAVTEAMLRARRRWHEADAARKVAVTRQRDLEALRAAQERLAVATSATQVGVFEWNISGTILWTATHDAIFGYPSDATTTTTTTTTTEYPYSRWAGRLHPEDRPRVEEELRRRLADGRIFEPQYRILWPDGSLHWIQTKAVFLPGPDGRPSRLMGVAIDITKSKAAEEAIRRNEQRLRLLLDTLPVGVTIAEDPRCQLITCNPAAARLYEAPEADSNVSASGPNPPPAKYFAGGTELRPEEMPMQLAVFNNRQVPPMEIEARLPSEARRTVLVAAAPLHDTGGSVVGGIAVSSDITDRKRMETALAAAHGQIQSVIDNTPALVYILDLEERFLMVNSALADLLHSTPQQMIGKRRIEFMPKEDADGHEANDRKAIEAGRALEFEEYSQLNGRSITWLTTKFPLRDAKGGIYAVAGITTDITDRKAAERELQDRNEELSRFNRATVGRELRMIELKRQVNELCAALGRPREYPLEFDGAAETEGKGAI